MRHEVSSPRSGRRPRLLVFKQLLVPMGGACGVTMHALRALRGEYDLTVASANALDLAALNRYYGTSFEPGDFEQLRMPVGVRSALKLLFTAGAGFARLQQAVQCRWLRGQAGRYDFVFSFSNEIDVGCAAAQYVHVPYGPVPPPASELRRVHRLPGALVAYYQLSNVIAPLSDRAIANNLTFVNSEWTGRRFRQRYGGSPVTLYPPVPAVESAVPWDSRAQRFVCIGRIAREKRQDVVIEIVERLRARGHDLRLEIIATEDDAADLRDVAALGATRPWVTMHRSIRREEVMRILAESRYGLHAMVDEHFGMAVAEMAAAGCIPFVHASAGPEEIVGDRRMTWSSVDEAVRRIEHVLGDAALQDELRAALAVRVRSFGFDSFRNTLRHHLAAAIEKASLRPVRSGLAR